MHKPETTKRDSDENLTMESHTMHIMDVDLGTGRAFVASVSQYLHLDAFLYEYISKTINTGRSANRSVQGQSEGCAAPRPAGETRPEAGPPAPPPPPPAGPEGRVSSREEGRHHLGHITDRSPHTLRALSRPRPHDALARIHATDPDRRRRQTDVSRLQERKA